MNKIAAIVMCGAFGYTAFVQYTVEILHNGRWSQSGSYGAAGGQQVGAIDHYSFRAMLWRGASQPPIDLHDPSWSNSAASATDGVREVGFRQSGPGVQTVRATMWSGTAQSWVNLHPPGMEYSRAQGIAGDVQVGMVQPLITTHITYAVLWRNTAESATLLHPPGYETSEAHATDGKQHVGFVNSWGTQERAVIWQDTGPRFVNLNPDGYHLSIAYGVSKGQQVGVASYQGNGHAALWYGSKETFVDLNPGDANSRWGSRAYATNGEMQVGFAGSNWPVVVHKHAATWRGTKESYVNLHKFLPAEYQGYLVGAESGALGIDADGVIVGYAKHIATYRSHAVLWRPVRRE